MIDANTLLLVSAAPAGSAPPHAGGTVGLGWRTSSELELNLTQIDAAAQLTARDEQQLGWKVLNDGCAASMESLIRANLRLVVAIAQRHFGRGVPLERLIGAGNAGLLHAVNHFDPAQGARFSTGASWWIKQALKQAFPDRPLRPSSAGAGPRSAPPRPDVRPNQKSPVAVS